MMRNGLIQIYFLNIKILRVDKYIIINNEKSTIPDNEKISGI